jgi:hypothetical protein
MVTSAGGEATPWREKRGDDAVGLTRFLLGKKIKKSKWSIQLLQMECEDLKQQ